MKLAALAAGHAAAGRGAALRIVLLLLAGPAAASRKRTFGTGGGAGRPERASLLRVVLDAAASAASDAELGSDARLAEAAAGRSQVGEGPATLEEYCSSGKAGPQPGMHVDADWMKLGTKYPGDIKEQNKDGTVDIAYDDGFDEKNVPMSRVRITEEPIDPKDDPACQLQDFLKETKEKVANLRKKVGEWVEERTKELTAVRGDAGAPEPAPKGGKERKKRWGEEPEHLAEKASEKQAEELKRLKEKLSGKDLEIEELEKELRETDEDIEDEESKDTAPRTVDDLIAMYRARVAERDKRIEKLKAKLDQRRKRLASLRDPDSAKKGPSLEDIGRKIEELSKEIDTARDKKARIQEDGKLDLELGHSLNALFEMQELLETQFRELQRLETQMQARKEAARRKAEKAEAEARREAELAGDSPEVAEAKAKKAAEDVAKEAEDMDKEVLKKARDVSKDLDKVQRSVKELDEGVHPHGEKWWRYRYEHAYVEACLMIVVCFLMLIWERIYHFMRWKVYDLSNAKEADRITHGTMYIGWLEFLAGELMTSLLVFLSCWALAQLRAFQIFPMILKGSSQLNLPASALEYRRLALDVCVVFFFAIIFYYALVLSVAHACTKKLEVWAQLESELQPHTPNPEDEQSGASGAEAEVERVPTEKFVGRTRTRTMAKQKVMLGEFIPRTNLFSSAEAKENYNKLKDYFFSKVHQEPALMAALQENFIVLTPSTFPFWIYIRLAVRRNTDKLFKFGCPIWACLMVTFLCLMFIHRFLHIGCVRVMFTFLGMVMVILALMVWWVHNIGTAAMKDNSATCQRVSPTASAAQEETGDRVCCDIHRDYSTEEGVIFALHFMLFFMCYLAARMICQPWMWRLHFWIVLWMTCLVILLGLGFVFVVAPMLPDFCVALAMPPYVDASDVKTMIEAIEMGEEMDEESMEEALKNPVKRKSEFPGSAVSGAGHRPSRASAPGSTGGSRATLRNVM